MWFSHVATLTKCTSDGLDFHDVIYDFRIKIPKGAIQEHKDITIDISVAEYGPFKYPQGFRPVSPVFWIRVRDPTFTRFMKLIEITIPHCLDLKTSDDSKSLTFLKSDRCQFNRVRGFEFRRGKTYGTLRLTSLHRWCIAGIISEEMNSKTSYYIYAAISRMVRSTMTLHCRFYVYLRLPTCGRSAKRQIDQISEFKGHTGIKQKFNFLPMQHTPALEVILPNEIPGGWIIKSVSRTKVSIICVSITDLFIQITCRSLRRRLTSFQWERIGSNPLKRMAYTHLGSMLSSVALQMLNLSIP